MVRASVGLILVPALLSLASPALARRHISHHADLAATYRYLTALHDRQLAAASTLTAAEDAVKALPAQVAAGCPNVLAGAPNDHATDEFRDETLTETIALFEAPNKTAVIDFARVVEPLRWSNRRLTRFARVNAEELRATAELVPPNICTDATAYAAGHFASVPATTTRFLHERDLAQEKISIVVQPPEHPPGQLDEKILTLLKPYERPDEKRLLPHKPSKPVLEQLQSTALKLVFEPAIEALKALGLPTGEAIK